MAISTFKQTTESSCVEGYPGDPYIFRQEPTARKQEMLICRFGVNLEKCVRVKTSSQLLVSSGDTGLLLINSFPHEETYTNLFSWTSHYPLVFRPKYLEKRRKKNIVTDKIFKKPVSPFYSFQPNRAHENIFLLGSAIFSLSIYLKNMKSIYLEDILCA